MDAALLDRWAEKLVEARNKNDLTQKQVAELLTVNQGTVSRWERGKIIPSEQHKQDLARIYSTPARNLFPLDA